MDEYIQYPETLCRLSGTNLPRTRVSAANKESFKSELWMKFRINVDLDSREIHPSSICSGCKRFLYRVRGCTLKHNYRKSRILHINVVIQQVRSPSGKHKTKRYLFTGLSHLQVSYPEMCDKSGMKMKIKKSHWWKALPKCLYYSIPETKVGV